MEDRKGGEAAEGVESSGPKEEEGDASRGEKRKSSEEGGPSSSKSARREGELTTTWPRSKPEATGFRHGWFLETHERVFEALLRRRTPTAIVELGSWYGASTRWLAERCPTATVYAIDLWDDEFILAEQGDHYGTMGDAKLRRMLRDHPLWETFVVNLWDLKDRVVPLRTTTTEGLRTVAQLGVQPELIYIDADHHYDAAKRDIETALTLFPDAVLVGDDYGHYDSVKRAVTETARAFGKVVHVDQNHCWAFAKIDSLTGRNFTPKPQTDTKFASLLDDFKRAASGPQRDKARA